MPKGRIRPLETEFEFAGFSFPRYIPELPPANLKKRKERSAIVYRTSPEPNTPNAFFYLDSDFQPGLRWKWCDEVEGVRINHTGWFCDDFQDQKIRGLVFHLPKSRGFLAGWSYGEHMAGEVDTSTIYESECLAARAADSLAERLAEAEREHNEQEEARIKAEEDAAEALKAMQEAVAADVERVGWLNACA